MTEEDSLITVRRSNLKIMKQELEVLKNAYELLFKNWLSVKGEYTTDARMRWAVFQEKAREYKELHSKCLANEKGL